MNGTASITLSASNIIAANRCPCNVVLSNYGPGNIFVSGDSAVSTSNGLLIAPGRSIQWNRKTNGTGIWAVAEGSTSTLSMVFLRPGQMVAVPQSGGTASWANQGMAASSAVNQGDVVCATAIVSTPANFSRVDVFIGTQRWLVGDGVKTADCYFSGDSGATARAFGAIVTGDKLYLGTTGAAAGGTSTTDKVTFAYNS